MGYQKHDQNSRDVSNNYRKRKTKKTISTDNGKIDIQVPREQLSTFEPKIVKKHERNISRLKIKYFSYIQKECLQETFRKQYIKCFIVI